MLLSLNLLLVVTASCYTNILGLAKYVKYYSQEYVRLQKIACRYNELSIASNCTELTWIRLRWEGWEWKGFLFGK